MFKNSNIKFLASNLIDCIVKIKNKNILFIHGDRLNQNNLSKSIQELKGKYITEGINIDYIIFGHIHECYISDYFARSGSLCGGNGYSYNRLNLNSKASQNIYIVNKNYINGIRIDLQNVEEYTGYI
jgi:predicted phosphodiesterase